MLYHRLRLRVPPEALPPNITRNALGRMDHYRTAQQVRAEFGSKPRRALIITTVVYESRAVQAHLVDVERIAGSNGDIYEMGRFPDPAGEWHVIHAITAPGNSDASVVATKAQHWGERERHQRRDRDRSGHRQSELPEQAAHDAAHEQQRNEHRDQGQADRQYGKGDFARPLERRLERQNAVLDMSVDVLDHNDGIIDYEADGDGECHERYIIETEVEHVHRSERTEQRQHHGDARYQCCIEVAKKEQDHRHDKTDGEREREFNVVDGSTD